MRTGKAGTRLRPVAEWRRRIRRERDARQSVVCGENATPYTGVIHEAALRMQLGSREIAHRQLLHLLDACERANVTLRVIPFAAGGFALLDTSLLYMEAANPHLDTVQMDAPTGPVFIDSPTRLANFRTRLDLAEQTALTQTETRDLNHSIAKEL
ncbi:DUF5753 domain-containing protein [Streptomyces sp. NPDC004749]